MATKKKFKKMLKQLINTMPIIMEQTHEDHVVDGTDLLAQGHFENGSKKIEADKQYVQPMPVLIARNHENRLKSLYKKHGRDGITSYVKEVKSIVAANA
jgi:hypothetical protein